jgi:hypothetical protein
MNSLPCFTSFSTHLYSVVNNKDPPTMMEDLDRRIEETRRKRRVIQRDMERVARRFDSIKERYSFHPCFDHPCSYQILCYKRCHAGTGREGDSGWFGLIHNFDSIEFIRFFRFNYSFYSLQQLFFFFW